ncbi:GlxA family transcriptional regulator [Inquilinus sp. OTU3971]|uniref:GlxA family transcriptional regulator n=1 Tax=Inquilinus sp. OTU3971 TaxID=3043855 RepID=UPI00313E5638
MASRPIHVVIWLPSTFYSAVAATIAEMFDLVNTIRQSETLSLEFVSRHARAATSLGVRFEAKPQPSRPMDALILLAMPGLKIPDLLRSLEAETPHAAPLIAMARQRDAIIAAHCGASYFLASSGVIDRKRATISWWLKADALKRFPRVKWDPSRLLIRHGRIYTCGGGFSGLELARALITDLGFEREERIVRKLLVLPPSRRLQTPYEFPLDDIVPTPDPFRAGIAALSREHLQTLNLAFLAEHLRLSPRTLARRFAEELQTTPGQWIQDQRMAAAKGLLEGTKLTVSEICYRVGYQDVASFSRLFSRTMGLPPGEYRRQCQ